MAVGISDEFTIDFFDSAIYSFIIFQEAQNVRLLIQARFEMTEVGKFLCKATKKISPYPPSA